MQTVYIVEDDENIRELVSYALNGRGFLSFSFENGYDFFEKLQEKMPDLVLIDIMLPGEDGLSILKRLKQVRKWENLPVVMLTAKGGEMDKVKGLDLGADDYVTKPFSVIELISRINAVLRRSARIKGNTLTYRTISIDDEKHIVFVNENPVTLTLKEYDLLFYLLNNAELVLSREKIIENIWGYDFEGETRTVDMHIKTLRQKLGTAGEFIRTVRGVGYSLGERN